MIAANDKRQSKRNKILKAVWITIKDHPFRLHDISNEGIGILLDAKGPGFLIGERIEKIPISLQSRTVHLSGLVSHISIIADGTVCGIRFLFDTEEFLSLVQFKKEVVI